MYALIIPFWKKTFDSIGYTYIIPEKIKDKIRLWNVVEFFLKEELTYGIIYDFVSKIDFDKSKLKEIIDIKSDFVFIDWYRLELLKFITTHYFTPIHNASSLFLSTHLRNKIINDKFEIKKYSLEYKTDFDIKLSDNQDKAYRQIINSENKKNLIFWVTWSWKTQIYIKLILEQLKLWNQSLFLIPEIILTNQLATRIKSFFWKDVLVINSSVTEATKTKYFTQIISWEAKIILWTRSSLFYPYKDLWLIIIDEEHDNSYVSDQSPRYNSIEIANKITDLNWNILLLWSWTPSINSMYDSINKKYNLVNLFEKYQKTDS